jgi:YfiH family protein
MQNPDFDCLVPDWPAPAHVRALCTTRAGGTSVGRYANLNLGTHVGDAPHAVAANRQRLQETLGAQAVFLEQVHGSTMVELDGDTPDGLQADGAATGRSGLACTVMVADCLPVLLCDERGRRVAAAHAGWRGLLGVQGQGILEAAVASMGALAAESQRLMAWLGPCIGPDAFEVGDEVRAAFVAASPQAAQCFRPAPSGKWLADLPGLARQRLQALGVARTFGNDGGAAWCTVTNASRFFSHRRDAVSGRMAACIWRAA